MFASHSLVPWHLRTVIIVPTTTSQTVLRIGPDHNRELQSIENKLCLPNGVFPEIDLLLALLEFSRVSLLFIGSSLEPPRVVSRLGQYPWSSNFLSNFRILLRSRSGGYLSCVFRSAPLPSPLMFDGRSFVEWRISAALVVRHIIATLLRSIPRDSRHRLLRQLGKNRS